MQSLFQKNKSFVHFVLDPIGLGGTSTEASFAARYGCLVTVEKVSFDASIYLLYALSFMFIHSTSTLVFLQVEKLDIGALVLIRGVGRVKLLEFRKVGHFKILKTTLLTFLVQMFQFH